MTTKRKLLKAFSLTMLFAMLNQILFPLTAKALTSGPTQPEVQSFAPMGANDLVDLFTGDFNYNIPLLDVGGYPVNLSYQSGIQMDQEASWVGLGWNLNVGAIVRNMRGIPDEFGGGTEEDQVTYTREMRTNRTWGVSLGKDFEFVGIKPRQNGVASANNPVTHSFGSQFSLLLQHNSYSGFDMSLSMVPGLDATGHAKNKWNASLGINVSGRDGSSVQPNLNFDLGMAKILKKDVDFTCGISTSINSRSGMRQLNLFAGSSFAKPNPRNRFGLASWNQGVQLAHPTYLPSIDFPMRTVSRNFSFKTGPGATGWAALNGMVIMGFYSKQELQKNTIVAPAFGYLNLQKGKDIAEAALDFNREKDGGLSKETPHLPLTNLTYDTYAVTGQGASGAFRAYRGDVGAVFDRASHTSSNGLRNTGFQYNVGTNNTIGLDWSPNWMNARNKKWVIHNDLLLKTDFEETNAAQALYQPATFRMMGEQTQTDGAFFTARGGTDPVRPKLSNTGLFGVAADPAWTSTTSDANTTAISAKVLRGNRMPGNTSVGTLSAHEAATLGLETSIPLYPLNGSITSPGTQNRWDLASGRKKHHPSEFTVLAGDGSRSVYGIPAYNKIQKDVTTSIGSDALNGTIPSYADGQKEYADAYVPLGRDSFLDVTELDPYAHSYLLSAYLSADYEDLTGDGPSPDDPGTYVKFNYTRDHTDFKWRSPFESKTGKHAVGFRADPTDDKLTYSYGEKEIWYLHSIETRDYLALFKLSQRRDGHGVLGEDGGINPAMDLKKLDRIDLFARREYLNPPPGQSAVPIKSVHFLYDYALCQDVPNNDGGSANPQANELDNQGGKLTLKHVYFTWYGSQKGKMNSYKFSYGGSNPDYNIQESDRWGCYAPSMSTDVDDLKNSDYPYVTPDSTLAATYAAAWSMDAIDLPSGGRIEVDYEADDYAYVQDRRAMRMFSIAGLSDEPDDANSVNRTVLYDHSAKEEYNYLYFNLEDPIHQRSDDLDDKRFYADYINGLGQYLYFKCLVELNALSWAPQPGLHKEFVAGYAELAREDGKIVAGLDGSSLSSGKYTRGYIKVKLESVQDQNQGNGLQVHPISKSAWDVMVLNQNHLVYRGSTAYSPAQNSFEGTIRGMLGAFRDIYLTFSSRNRWMHNQQGYGKNIDKSQSFIRLPEPDRTKYGGGLRVKEIRMYDNWDDMTGVPGSGFSYGQQYDYTINEMDIDLETGDAVNRWHSSGVAAYEPLMGGDENPFRQPVKYEQSNFLAADDRYFQEEPMGESMFPSPSVGYSKVTVRNLSHTDVRKNATGYAVNEFYTAKDFPTIVKNTSPKKVRTGGRFIPSFLKAGNRDYMTAAEGFVVERNDMHGKPKSVFAYPEPDASLPLAKLVGREISGTRYYYHTDAENTSRLANEVEVIHPDGSVSTADLGMTMDLVTDMREYNSHAQVVNLQNQIDLETAMPFPLPSAIPSLTKEHTRFRSAVVTKTIDRYGILEKVVKYDRQAQIPTENVAYDSETGQALLTRTWNEFKQPIYDFSYPAHWAYDAGMGQAYKTLEYRKKTVSFDQSLGANGKIDVGSQIAHFAIGDQVYLDGQSGLSKMGPFWVNQTSGNNIYIVDRDGILQDHTNLTPGTFDVVIIRTARKNMAGAGMASVQLLEESPIVAGNLNVLAQKDHVLASSAVEYSDDWKMLLSPIYPAVNTCDWEPYLNAIANMVNTFNTTITFPNGTYYEGEASVESGVDTRVEGAFYDCNGNLLADFNGLIQNTNSNCQNSVSIINVVTAPDPNNPGHQLVSFELTCPFAGTNATVLQSSWICPPNWNAPMPNCPPGTFPNTADCLPVGSVVNPFLQGLKGHWRPLKSYAFLEDRAYKDATIPRLREDGVLADFVPFWQYSGGKWHGDHQSGNPISGTPHEEWQYASVAEKYHPRGLEVESSDPIVTFSGAILGYDQSLVSSMGQNAEYRQLAFDGFEDYVLRDATASQCELYHWDFIPYAGQMSTEAAHSGLRSLKVEGAFPTMQTETFHQSGAGSYNADKEYQTGWDDRLSLFEPTEGSYVLLAWTRQEDTGSNIPPMTADRSRIQLYFTDGDGDPIGTPVSVGAKGVMIEGWQRMEYEFAVPSLPPLATWPVKMYVRFENTDPSKGPVYYDDVRISPRDAIVSSYVYHPYNRRLMAELDANHYATFYEYDEEGALVRVKKETERGIHTVQEARTSIRKVSLNN